MASRSMADSAPTMPRRLVPVLLLRSEGLATTSISDDKFGSSRKLRWTRGCSVAHQIMVETAEEPISWELLPVATNG
ncbi:hypothetical protein LX36DRAFT_39164 [Colletotrichum falcatum]|nr:hypothetical protein LX36DRAFT_39164 [Colletotrichum falcatum]